MGLCRYPHFDGRIRKQVGKLGVRAVFLVSISSSATFELRFTSSILVSPGVQGINQAENNLVFGDGMMRWWLPRCILVAVSVSLHLANLFRWCA